MKNSSSPIVCPVGSYCLAGTRYANEYLCPSGTYNPSVGLHNVSSCKSCIAGMYCEGSGLSTPTGNCTAGYYCGGGSSVSTPFDSDEITLYQSYLGDSCWNTSKSNDMCPHGHYCPIGSASPIPCPVGTNSSSRGLLKESDCPSCVGGYYCNNTGTILAVNKCVEGYFCPPGTVDPVNVETDLSCPRGSYCALGSWKPVECDAGYYQDNTGQSSCKVL